MKNKKKLYLTEKLKLDDKKIKEHISSWSYETRDQDGNPIIKQKKKQSYTPFDVPKKSRLKGLKLCEYKDKKGNPCGKYFVGNYKYNGVSKYYPLGKFIPGRYGIKEACDDWTELNKKHTNNKGHWGSCPLEAKQKAKIIITKEEAVEKKKEPTSQVIEDYCKAGFPRAKYGGPIGLARNRWDFPYDVDKEPPPSTSYHIAGTENFIGYGNYDPPEEEKQETIITWDEPVIKDPGADYKPGKFKFLDEQIKNSKDNKR